MSWLRRSRTDDIARKIESDLRAARDSSAETQTRITKAIERFRLLSELASAEDVLREKK